MKKAEATIQLHKPSTNEFLFFLLSGAVVSVPLTLFLEQNFVTPFLTGLPTFDVTLLTLAILAPVTFIAVRLANIASLAVFNIRPTSPMVHPSVCTIFPFLAMGLIFPDGM